ncbi:NAD(P)H-quinone oxidoreductase [Shewanella psychrotolerans]|uniref:NAD(P)H-quinone oxidoreductase n=1 Tax=Shewanella psychrotolerans TaxID=2864206 RepID=UPI001C65A5C6|nr:NAD(P)H-quinone oxidoreductase [Shewanella psychrotolerans]QYK00962.1 NAD(P)H-quinone oxidoreductase [Shewanella psychrotolerans]
MAEQTDSCKQIIFDQAGGPEVLYIAESNVPKVDSEQVLIKVSYAGVNGPDIAQRKGMYPPPPGASEVLGLEVSGTIVAVGDSVSQWQVGDVVCALVPGAGYSEYVVTWGSHCLPIPSGLTLAQAAALPETFFTVWGHLFMRGALKAGETVLIHGGSGGIGSAAIALAKQFGIKVIATSGSQDKCDYCKQLGADYAFNYHDTDLLEQLLAVAPDGVDVALDMASGDMINLNLKALAVEGRLVTIALLRGPTASVDVFRLMSKRITWTGATLRPQSIEAKARIAKRLLTDVWPLFLTSQAEPLVPHIFAEFSFDKVAEAHQLMESGRHYGKIVLKMAAEDVT